MGFFTLDHDLTLLGLLLVVVFILFAFRQGQKVKPDRTRRVDAVEDWTKIGGIGPGDADPGSQ